MAEIKKQMYYLRNKKRDTEKYKKRRDDNDDDDDDSDEDYETEDEEDMGYDTKEMTKLISKIFPSKYMNDKIDVMNGKVAKDNKLSKVNKNKKKKNKKDEDIVLDNDNNTVHIICTIDDQGRSSYDEDEDSSYYEEESYDEDEYDSEDDEEEEDEDEEDDEEDDDDDEEEDDDDEEDDEDEEDDDDEGDDDEEEDDDDDGDGDKKTKNAKTTKKSKKNGKSEEELIKEISKYAKDLKKGNKNSKLIKDFIKTAKQKEDEMKKKENKKSKKERVKNVKKFKKIVRDNNSLNDYKFFENLTVKNQQLILKELKKVCKVIKVEKPYRLKLLESDIPLQFKACALKKINTLRHMDPMAGDYYKLQYWVDAFMRIPFNKYNTLPVNQSDGVEKCQSFMEDAICSLNNAVYGMNDAKMQIVQLLGQWITNPNAIGCAIAIKGPPGTGKTTLVKEGISKLLNREFAFIALGGATDSSFLEGHSYTYEGSTWGKVVDILVQKQSMNPVIYFDELDKISDTPKGEEIIGILTHLTDTSQNDKFHDKYFSEIDFDLSKCLFIFSYNDESKINPILIDRMYRIQTNGYSAKEKIHIVKDYLLPKIKSDVKLDEEITFTDEVIGFIIDRYTGQEKGVRNLKRCIEIIYRKLNLFKLMKPGAKLFDDNLCIKVEFPLEITKDLVDKLVKKQEEDNVYHHSLYL